MHELMARVTAATGLDEARAEQAVGIVLSLIRKEGDQGKVDELFARLPGAEELAAKHADAKSAGLFGMLGGALGGPLAAVGKLQAAGLSMDQINVLGRELLGFARERAGEPLVNDVAGSIPGLSRYL
ncbi:MAG: DUF2267 domain-containing protein [Hyphomicrobiales bacterium]